LVEETILINTLSVTVKFFDDEYITDFVLRQAFSLKKNIQRHHNQIKIALSIYEVIIIPANLNGNVKTLINGGYWLHQ